MRSQQPDTEQEGRLVELLLQGDPMAIKGMLDAWRRAIGRSLQRHFRGVLDYDEIEGVMVATVIRAYENRHLYRPEEGGLRAWFTAIAWNTARDEGKTKFRQVSREDLDDMEDTRTATGLHQFFHWCQEQGIGLEQMGPMQVAAYAEQYPGIVDVRESAQMDDAIAKIQTIRAAMEQLSENERVVINKFNVKAAVLAEELGTAIGTIDSLKHRAVKKIRAFVEQYGHGG